MLQTAKLLDLVYLHECALLAGSVTAELRKSYTEEYAVGIKPVNGNRFSPNYIKSLSSCLSNAYEMLDTFLSISVEDLRWQPIFQFARIVYALVVLVKVTLGTASKSTVGMEEMNDSCRRETSNYMNSVLERFELVADGTKCPSAAMFCQVIASLKSFFQRLASISDSQSRLNNVHPHSGPVSRSSPTRHGANHGTQSAMPISHSDSRSDSEINSSKNESPLGIGADEHNVKQHAAIYQGTAPTTSNPGLFPSISHPSRSSSSIPTTARTQTKSSHEDQQNTGSSRSSSNYVSSSIPPDDSNWPPDLVPTGSNPLQQHWQHQQFAPSTGIVDPNAFDFNSAVNNNGGYEQLFLDDEMMWMLSQSNPLNYHFDNGDGGSGGGDMSSWP